MKTSLKNGLKAGIPFGIVSIFLFLIGFNSTISDIILKYSKINPKAVIFGLTPGPLAVLIFMGLIGIWAGTNSSRKIKNKTAAVILMGTLAGLVHGAMVVAVSFIIGTANASGVKINTYLSQMLPQTIKLFLLEKTPLEGSVIMLVFLTAMGALGGLLSYSFDRANVWKRIGAGWKGFKENYSQNTIVRKIQSSPLTRYIVYGVILITLGVVPLIAGSYWNYTIGTVGIYVLLGLGLNIIVGMAGLLVLGYVAFFAIGAYTTALLTAPVPHHLMWNFWWTIPIGMLLAALAGILLGIPVLRMRGDYLAIVTLGFGEIIRILIKSDLLTSFTGGPKGVTEVGGPTLFGRPFNTDVDFVYLILLSVLFAVFVTVRLQNSRVGRAWEAMREDETVSRAMGINTLWQKLLAFSIGAALAGLAGVLFASRNQFTGPEDHALMVSINVLSAVIVGGMGSIPGVIAGAFVLKGLPEILRELENYRVLTFGALLVVMMLVRPAGLFPPSRRKLDPDETINLEASKQNGRPQ
jgi:branched-chain amino acid transport system permease protein